ncbi:hypothetical protein HKD37_13G035474 [Glycine soja]
MNVFDTRDDVLQWARSVAHENRFVAVIIRSDTQTGSGGRSSFVLIGCERSGQYRCRKKEFVRRDTGSKKCECPFKLRGKPVIGGQCWMVKLICGIHNHELAKSLVGHSYAERLIKDEKTIIADMTKSMVKPRNILLALKEHNANSCTTIKQIYNARSAYRSSIRGSDTEMQHLMKLLERDQYIHWHRLKDEDVVRDIFWCHLDAVKLCNACHLVFLIYSTYKTNKNRLQPLDFVGVTPTRMTFSAGFAYLEGEHVNNVVWALERFRGLNLLIWALKKVLHNSLGDLCSVWDAMNNMITLQHTKIKASFETSTHVVGHVFKKKTLYKRLLGMIARYALNQIATEFECVHYAGKNPSSCGCVMRTTHGLPCACELSKYVLGSILLDSIHMFWRRLSFSDQGLSEPQVTIKEEMETISKRFEELDVCGKVTLKSKFREIAYPDQNSMCPPPSKDFIDNIVDVKADGNCGYRLIAALLGMGEDSWSLVRNHLLKELAKWSDDYINLFGGTDRFKELRRSLLVDGLSKVTVDGYSRDGICHCIKIYLKDRCPLLPLALLWSRNSHPQAK